MSVLVTIEPSCIAGELTTMHECYRRDMSHHDGCKTVSGSPINTTGLTAPATAATSPHHGYSTGMVHINSVWYCNIWRTTVQRRKDLFAQTAIPFPPAGRQKNIGVSKIVYWGRTSYLVFQSGLIERNNRTIKSMVPDTVRPNRLDAS